jgi:hypothetical protein
MKKCLLLAALLVSALGFSQTVNDYQYVIVPTKFSIFNDNDRYRLNTSTKMLLEKYGFKTYMSNDVIPNEIGDNCKKLYADLVQDKDLFATKIKLVLKDCKERIVYETEYGKSREKDFAVAYNQALRETAKSFEKLNYAYNGKNGIAAETAEVAGDTQEVTAVASPTDSAGTFFFAQPTANGFQVVDSEPKVIMRLFNTSQKNVFIGQKGNVNGVVINKNGQWFFEFYENAKLVSEPLKLKF